MSEMTQLSASATQTLPVDTHLAEVHTMFVMLIIEFDCNRKTYCSKMSYTKMTIYNIFSSIKLYKYNYQIVNALQERGYRLN